MGFLTVFGHTNIDCLATVPRLPRPDESMAFEGPLRALGGTAANIAAAAGALGTPVSLASFVGPDFPPAFRRELTRRGVSLAHLRVLPGSTTPVCWIFMDASERQLAFINQGAAEDSARMPVDRRAVTSARLVHIATGPPAYHLRAAALAHRLGRPVSFDPGQELAYLWTPALLRRMLRFTRRLFLNDAERRTALRYLRLRRDRDLLAFADELVLTHGRRGAEFRAPRERFLQPAVASRRTVNTTGAGDAFRGGFYAALWRGLDPPQQLLWGAAAASFAVETHGAVLGVPAAAKLQSRLRSAGSRSSTQRGVQ